jgi:hypothetical protein
MISPHARQCQSTPARERSTRRGLDQSGRHAHLVEEGDSRRQPYRSSRSRSRGCGRRRPRRCGRPQGTNGDCDSQRRLAIAMRDLRKRVRRRSDTPPVRPTQEGRSRQPTRSLAGERGRGVVSRLSPPHRAWHRAGLTGRRRSAGAKTFVRLRFVSARVRLTTRPLELPWSGTASCPGSVASEPVV